MKLIKVVMIAPLLVVSVMASPLLAGPKNGGGGGGAPPPPPPPPPVSTPSDANASLMNLQLSEKFDNNSATLITTTDRKGIQQSSVASGAMTIAYNAATGGYTLTNGSRNQTFAPANIDQVRSSPLATVYSRSASGVVDTLTLTKPGTSGPLTYQYVGAGFWDRVKADKRSSMTTLDAFTYGVETEDVNLPRSGQASYDIELIGSIRNNNLYTQLYGTGSMEVLFGDGTLSFSGGYNEFLKSDGSYIKHSTFGGSAALSSTANTFNGGISVGSSTGLLNGRFYGPAAAEVGAVWHLGTGGVFGVGTILGRIASPPEPEPDPTTDLLHLNSFVGLSGFRMDHFQKVDADTGETLREGAGARDYLSQGLVIYDPSGQRWTLESTFNQDASTFDVASSDATYARYGDVTPDANGVDGLTLLKPGPGNPIIELTYVTYGDWMYGSNFGGTEYEIGHNEAVFGFITEDGDVPTSGTASYSGVIFGAGSSVLNPFTAIETGTYYSLRGETKFSIDFENNSWAGTLNPVGVDRNSSNTRDFGTFGFTNGALLGTSLSLSELTDASNTPVGGIWGQLFGPQGAEAGGGFTMDLSDPLQSGYRMFLNGLYVAKKD